MTGAPDSRPEELTAEGRAWLRAVRLSALIAAFSAPGRSLNESTLYKVLAIDQHFAITRRQVAGLIRFLGSIGLAYADDTGHGMVLTLSDDGADLVLGRGTHPDVDQPSTGTTRRLALQAAAQLAKSTLGSP